MARHKWKWITALILTALGAWWLVSTARRQGFRWQAFLATLSHLDWRWLVLAIFCAIATYGVRAIRWAVLMRPVSPHPRLRNLFSATVIGFAAVTVLGRPGEFVRPYLISMRESVSFSSQIAAWLLERMFDTIIALVVFGFALAHVQSSELTVGPGLTWVLAVGGRFVAFTAVVSLILFLLLRHFSDRMRTRLLDALAFLSKPQLERVEKLVTAFVQGAEATRSGAALALLTLYTVLEWLVIAASYMCITRAFGGSLHFGWTDVLIFMGFVSFGSVVQIPGIGGGVQVATVLVLTELFRVPLEVATSLALLLWIITFVVVVPFGVVLAVREGLDWAKLKSLRREVEL